MFHKFCLVTHLVLFPFPPGPAGVVNPLYLQYANLEEDYGLSKQDMRVIESGFPDKDTKVMCLQYVELEQNLGEIDHARALHKHSSQFTDPDFWNKWHEIEVQHGNKDIFREILHVKRIVSASYIQMGSKSVKVQYVLEKGSHLWKMFVPLFSQMGFPSTD
ncbi:hypothetical protein H5410_045213 [Solanum commersonii]|uniref:Pre-mRNA-splicing factor Syf1/CRNKL1-like C-terminal HAT-repeats domain-containing protein n=1 Tax=Solanum commersonii TaxID=4109 RepID=A0A9J5X913_SOLCO|nr:hypothetical protein H5410_045213 [Solanum commersonii]